MVEVKDDLDRVVAEGRVLPPQGGERARISWWTNDVHELSIRRGEDYRDALDELTRNARAMNRRVFGHWT